MKIKRHGFLIIWFILTLTSLAFNPAQTVTFSQVVVDPQFNDRIGFEAQIDQQSILDQIESIEIQVDPTGSKTMVETVDFDVSGLIQHTLDISQSFWRPFTTVFFRFHTKLLNGSEFTSETYSFYYEDNRQEWKTISSDQFIIKWDTDDNQLGPMILQTAINGLQSVQDTLGTSPREQMRIYAYSDPEDLQSALQQTDLALLAGHANPQQHIILLTTSPGPGLQLELSRQIPHEIAHLLVYELSKDGFEHLPVWLNEGIATINELYPNADYQRMLNSAAETGGLIPMQSLCETFPTDPNAAYLAFAQSGSFVNFLYKKFGTTGLESLIREYGNDVACSAGLSNVFNENLPELEYQWQQEVLGIDSNLLVLQNLSPYATILLILVLAPITPFLIKQIRPRMMD